MEMENHILEALLYNPNSSSSESSDSSCDSIFFNDGNKTGEDRQHLVKMSMFVENVVRLYSDNIFISHFRMNRQTAYMLIDLLDHSNFLPKHLDGRKKIPAEKAFLLALWYLSNSETFRQISDRFDVTRSSAHRTIKRVLKFILSLKTRYIKWPTEDELEAVATGFKNVHGIENVIGAIDGSHIEIGKPKENQDAYINRKGYHSILLQGIVDNKKKFTDVFCGEPGSLHDARLLRKSGIYKKISQNPNFIGKYLLLGDTAYPNLSWLVTPFKDNSRLTQNQKIFNYRISATRVVVENAFGLLKGRFRRLTKLDNLSLITCSEIVMAACVLHNICLEQNDFIEVECAEFNQPEIDHSLNQPLPSEMLNNITRQQQLFNEMFSS